MGAGGASFHPGSMGGGGPFGSIQGAPHNGYHAVEKPLKVCTLPGNWVRYENSPIPADT